MKLQMNSDVKQYLNRELKGKVLYNEPMRKHTSFRIGGPADALFTPADISDLKNCILISKKKNIPLFITGGGTNLLVRDEGIRGIVVNMRSRDLKNIYPGKHMIQATSSVGLSEFLAYCAAQGFSGLEFLSGIPGTVGGGMVTNVKARDYKNQEKFLSIRDYIEEAKIMSYDGIAQILNKRELSSRKELTNVLNGIVLEVKFLLSRAPRKDILIKSRKILKLKKAAQDMASPSAGCIFKNPLGISKSAGQMIDECRLKGLRVGDAMVSKKHANYIVNMGKARSKDVLELIEVVKDKVGQSFGIELVMEIKVV